jgi:hypothetical protein
VPPDGRVARGRRLRRLARTALPNLFELHPEARTASRRNLGLLTIPIAAIRGTAVDGPAQRAGDFLPLPALRGQNWEARWQRIRAAQNRLAILPPIEVLEAAGGYWVVDGHNRVALAMTVGQDDIDADVTHLHLPGAGDDAEVVAGDLTTVLEGSRQLRAAGTGRLTPGSSVPEPPPPPRLTPDPESPTDR